MFPQVCPNGLIHFELEQVWPRPVRFEEEAFQINYAVLSPFWVKIDNSTSTFENVGSYNHSAVFYHVYTPGNQLCDDYVLGNATEDVRNLAQSADFSRFTATWVLVVTWLRLRPQSPDNIISEKVRIENQGCFSFNPSAKDNSSKRLSLCKKLYSKYSKPHPV